MRTFLTLLEPISSLSISGLEGVYVANNFATSEGNAMENIEWNTYMSYNKGLTWGTLTPPDNLNCPGCTLNLWGTTDTKGNADPRGRSTALGTVVAIGSSSLLLSLILPLT